MAISVGQTLGNYRVVEKLGSGGMGAVYLAEHPLIGKRVALKVIHRELAQNREVVTRFFNEARAVNQIRDEHIVDITDFGQTPEGEHFFVMEHLDGKSLAAVLARDPVLPVRRALKIAYQIAGALGAAHAHGIIHRDLKPDNIFLVTKMGKPDFVKLLDFGLAKLLEHVGPSQLTKAGVVLGTPQYMSPEQCESRPGIDARSDVYALGVLLYQMTTGVLPFDGRTMGDILVKHVSMPPRPPRQIDRRLPVTVEAIILRCLEKEPRARFASMKELRSALGRELQVSPSVKLPRRRPALIGGLIGGVGGVALAAVLILRGPTEEPAAVVTPPPMAAPIVVVPAPPVPPPPPPEPKKALAATSVIVALESEPPGAEVIDERSGAVVGRTPVQLTAEQGAEMPLVIRLAGYDDRRQMVRAVSNVDIHVELVKKSRSPRRPARKMDDELLAPH